MWKVLILTAFVASIALAQEAQRCPENEVWNGCANGGCFGPRRCSDPNGIKCVDLIEGACKGACICRDNLLRNANGICVQPSQCPPQPCPENEVWNSCANGGCFGPRRCSDPKEIKCVNLIEGACRGACICRDNLLRNSNGICVQPSQCPPLPA